MAFEGLSEARKRNEAQYYKGYIPDTVTAIDFGLWRNLARLLEKLDKRSHWLLH